MKYNVTITETLETIVTIDAESVEEAEKIAEDLWKDGEFILDSENFTGVEFNADIKEKEND